MIIHNDNNYGTGFYVTIFGIHLITYDVKTNGGLSSGSNCVMSDTTLETFIVGSTIHTPSGYNNR